jgi:hypothetical protein
MFSWFADCGLSIERTLRTGRKSGGTVPEKVLSYPATKETASFMEQEYSSTPPVPVLRHIIPVHTLPLYLRSVLILFPPTPRPSSRFTTRTVNTPFLRALLTHPISSPFCFLPLWSKQPLLHTALHRPQSAVPLMATCRQLEANNLWPRVRAGNAEN